MNLISIAPMISLQSTVSTGPGFSANIIQMFIHAGLVVKIVLLILILFSVISWAIMLMKWRFFRNARRETSYFLDIFWDTTELKKVYKECDALLFSPIAQLFRAGYTELIRMKKIQDTPSSKDGNPGLNGISENIERALKRTAIQQGSRLDRTLSFSLHRAFRYCLGYYGIFQGNRLERFGKPRGCCTGNFRGTYRDCSRAGGSHTRCDGF
jgi:hypothetical protein